MALPHHPHPRGPAPPRGGLGAGRGRGRGGGGGPRQDRFLPTWGIIPTGPMYNLPLPLPIHALPNDQFYNYPADLENLKDKDDNPISVPPTLGATGNTEVFTNHLQVSQLPKEVHVYSITYGRNTKKNSNQPAASGKQAKAGPSSSSAGPTAPAANTPPSPKPKHEKKRIFEEIKPLFLADFYGWASDFDQIWSVRPILAVDEKDPKELELDNIEYRLRSGRWSSCDRITIKKTGIIHVSGDQQSLEWREDPEQSDNDGSEHIASSKQSRVRALNALLLQHMQKESRGANMQNSTFLRNTTIFLTEAWQRKDDLIFPRGYVLSLRPIKESSPLLLNINIVNTAFLPPMTVAALFNKYCTRNVKNVSPKEFSDMLQGKLLRLMWRRGHHPIQDPRVEGERIVLFQGFARDFLPPSDLDTHYTEHDKQGNTLPIPGCMNVVDYYHSQLPPDRDVPANADMLGDGASTLRTRIAETEVPAVRIRKWTYEEGQGKSKTKTKKIAEEYVPAELLEIVPYQPITRLLPSALQEAMIEYAVRKPSYNINLIVKEGLRDLGILKAKYLTELTKIKIEPQLMRLHAVRLVPPTLQYGNNVTAKVANASWDLQAKSFHTPKPVGRLYVVRVTWLSNPRQEFGQTDWDQQVWTYAYNQWWFAKDFAKVMKTHGLLNQNYEVNGNDVLPDIQLDRNNSNGWEGDIMEGLRPLGKRFVRAKDVLLILLPGANRTKDRSLYAAIKKVTDRDIGIHAAVCALPPASVAGTTVRVDHQKISNIVLKFNFRRGGQVHDAILPNVKAALRDTIILGADVTHPSNADPDKGTPSIAAVVGTLGADVTHYGGSMRIQRGRQESIAEMKEMVLDRLRGYQSANNGQIPAKILMYRDGVGEDSMDEIHQAEVKAIRDAYTALQAPLPRITYLFVTKRHNTRFYPAKEGPDHVHTNGNVPAGLLVNHSITPANHTNFYLQSHHAIQGTARAAHYTVMQDDMGLGSGDTLHNVTHVLTYAFARATKGVSYAAPAYVADRLCERGNVYLRRWQLDDTRQLYTPNASNVHPNGQQMTWSDLNDTTKTSETARFAQSANEPWYQPNNPSGNPWNQNLNNYMFWM